VRVKLLLSIARLCGLTPAPVVVYDGARRQLLAAMSGDANTTVLGVPDHERVSAATLQHRSLAYDRENEAERAANSASRPASAPDGQLLLMSTVPERPDSSPRARPRPAGLSPSHVSNAASRPATGGSAGGASSGSGGSRPGSAASGGGGLNVSIDFERSPSPIRAAANAQRRTGSAPSPGRPLSAPGGSPHRMLPPVVLQSPDPTPALRDIQQRSTELLQLQARLKDIARLVGDGSTGEAGELPLLELRGLIAVQKDPCCEFLK